MNLDSGLEALKQSAWTSKLPDTCLLVVPGVFGRHGAQVRDSAIIHTKSNLYIYLAA
jgi:hypothetical protein